MEFVAKFPVLCNEEHPNLTEIDLDTSPPRLSSVGAYKTAAHVSSAGRAIQKGLAEQTRAQGHVLDSSRTSVAAVTLPSRPENDAPRALPEHQYVPIAQPFRSLGR